MKFDYTELREGEKWVGNTAVQGFPPAHLQGLKTLRLGVQAYDINGKKLEGDYKPLIVHQSEYDQYNNIMQNL